MENKDVKYVEVYNNQIAIEPNVLLKWNALRQLKKEYDELDKQIKLSIQNAMEQNGIKKFESEKVVITYIPETSRSMLDSKKAFQYLQDEGLLDDFVNEVSVKPQVRVKWK